MEIIPLTNNHWPEVKAIYESGIAKRNATFQTAVPDWKEWDSSHLKECRLIAQDKTGTVGWAALTPVSGRCVNAGDAEVRIYVDENACGKGRETVVRKTCG